MDSSSVTRSSSISTDNKFSLVGRPSSLQLGPVQPRDRQDEIRRQGRARRALGGQPAARASTTGIRCRVRLRSRSWRKSRASLRPTSGSSTWDAVSRGATTCARLRHGMVGQPGWELFGPWEQGEEVKAAIVKAGEEHGIRQVGARTYPTSCLESGWIPSPLPAVYTGSR